MEEIKSVPHVPMSHPFVERLIGSIRGELLDHTFFWTATDLEDKLRGYQAYYNESRCHSSRDGDTSGIWSREGRRYQQLSLGKALPWTISTTEGSLNYDFARDMLLEHQTDLEPTEIMSDSAGASEIVFALFWLLGYQFSPRLADVGGARFWRINADADYSAFNDLSRHRVQVNRSIMHWDDILRIVGSLQTGVVSASELMRSLLSTKRASPVARALRELGRIVKTIHHLNYISDPVYRRRTLTQLNHHENRHRLT
jgi:hypothetical protein